MSQEQLNGILSIFYNSYLFCFNYFYFKNSKIKELKNAFKLFDKDNSGTISTNEIKDVLDQVGLELKTEELNELIHVLDKNKDGIIEFNGKFFN
jgi:calmodulin